MTASSPVTMEDLVNGLKFFTSDERESSVGLHAGDYKILVDSDAFNTVSISSNGLTVTFGNYIGGGPDFAGFTFNE